RVDGPTAAAAFAGERQREEKPRWVAAMFAGAQQRIHHHDFSIGRDLEAGKQDILSPPIGEPSCAGAYCPQADKSVFCDDYILHDAPPRRTWLTKISSPWIAVC